MPGKHNILNALGVFEACKALGVEEEIIFKGLSKFSGTWRRFEILKENPYALISDYAHHPTEIKATLEAAREKYPDRRIVLVFQPHQYQRTLFLFDEFVEAFFQADKIILAEIFSVAGREKEEIKDKVSSQKLAQAIGQKGQDAIFIKDKEQVLEYLKKEIKDNDVVIVMGAGDIVKITEKLL